ncbi:hypothetical protein ADIARSV_1519 [Arcticibacter svalbardensis MN12-7]|uniref:Tetratricopeptide repeat protein n=1 Tax=Arcticibacter svalbardensis MN12-7 TaxID=1150600 RepID=R9GUD5_9SPHI|nr:hypothetical protein [Arcticibacter svalbardensis]EOR95288.1 hypothetical protein ADIARSV_1519 [Arcticibacter svalbardensis MN12-7]
MRELQASGNREFIKFLSPSDNWTDADKAALKYLVLKFPYCQPLHFANASALRTESKDTYDSYLKRASVYAPKRDILYRFINEPQYFQTDIDLSEGIEEPVVPEVIVSVEVEPALPDEPEETLIETVTPESESLAVEEEQLEEEEPAVLTDQGLTESIETVIPDIEILTTEATLIKSDDRLALQSVASSDYFRFNRSQLDPLQPEEKKETEEVSRYDDDTMPNTFLWWLHKTRKEYERDFQPYTQKPTVRTNQMPAKSPQLNQQIIENIFHIQPELNTIQAVALPPTVEFELRKKETKIIENFIKEEPQIKPPSMAKVDTENKARKSSEDKLDLVSETLAQIYVDQMLFDKAIETYKKLSLKYPDKSLYFASQIQHLEKKI